MIWRGLVQLTLEPIALGGQLADPLDQGHALRLDDGEAALEAGDVLFIGRGAHPFGDGRGRDVWAVAVVVDGELSASAFVAATDIISTFS